MGSGSSKGPKPVLYVRPCSPPCRAVLMAAKAANIQLEVKAMEVLDDEEFIKVNPERQVPALDDKDFKISESRAIMTYLVDTYAPGHQIYPKDTKKRAVIDRLLYKDISFISPAIFDYMIPQIREKKAADGQKASEVEKVLDYIENILKEGEFLTGEHVTLADFSIMAALSFVEVNDWQFDRWSKIDGWRRKMKSLTYYEEVNKPLEELKEKLARKDAIEEIREERKEE